jgi:hypothetical protein
MTDLQCLLLTGDSQVVDVVNSALLKEGVTAHVVFNPNLALEALHNRHFDGVLIDCDDFPGAKELIQTIRSAPSTCQSVIMAFVNGDTKLDSALHPGTNFVLQKPLSKERMESYLHLALVFLNREFRRYFRYKVELPVRLSFSGNVLEVKTINISEGGLGLAVSQTSSLPRRLHLRFFLPTANGTPIDADGEVVWSKSSGQVGIRFLSLSPNSAGAFHDWLESLHHRSSEDFATNQSS